MPHVYWLGVLLVLFGGISLGVCLALDTLLPDFRFFGGIVAILIGFFIISYSAE